MAEATVGPKSLHQREYQQRTWFDDRLALDFECGCVRATGFFADAPATLWIRVAIDGLGNREAARAIIGGGVLQPDCLLRRNAKAGQGAGHGVDRSFPDRLPLPVQREHFEIRQTSSESAVGAVPHANFLEGRVGAKVQFPPGIVLGLRQRRRASVEITVAVAVDGPAGVGAAVGARLAGPPFRRHISAPVENLDFRKREHALRAGQLNANKTGAWRLGLRRADGKLEFVQDRFT